MDRRTPPRIFRPAPRAGGEGADRADRRRLLRADSHFHPPGRPAGTDHAHGRLHGAPFRAPPGGRVARRARLGATASGVWPGTYDHCYGNHWLEDFFTALEAESSWLRVSTPGEYLAAHPPVGRADLPAASYSEMMEWVLPTRVRQRYNAVQQEFTERSEVQFFLRGGPWRGFFRNYPGAKL